MMNTYSNPQEQEILLPDLTGLTDATDSDMDAQDAWTAPQALSASSPPTPTNFRPPNRPGNGGHGKILPPSGDDSETDDEDDLPIVNTGRGKLQAMAAQNAARETTPETVIFEASNRGPNALTNDNRTNLHPDVAGLPASASSDEIEAAASTQLIHMSRTQPNAAHTAGRQTRQLCLQMATKPAEMPTPAKTTQAARALATLLRIIAPGLGKNGESTTEISYAVFVLAKAVIHTSKESKKRPKTKAELDEKRKLRAQKSRLNRLAKKAQQSANKIAATVAYSNPVTE